MKFNKKIICIFLVILIPLLILLLENKESFSLGGPSKIIARMKQLKKERKEKKERELANKERELANKANKMIRLMKISTDENGQEETITSANELTRRIQAAVHSQLNKGMTEEVDETNLAQLSETDLKSVAANIEFRRLMQKAKENPLINEKFIRKRLGLERKLTNKYEKEAPIEWLFRTRKQTRSEFENATKMYTSAVELRQQREKDRAEKRAAKRAAAAKKAKRNATPQMVEARIAHALYRDATTLEEKRAARPRMVQATAALKLMREAPTTP